MADLKTVVADFFKLYDDDASGTLHIDDSRPLYARLRAERPDLNLTDEGYEEWFSKIDGDDSKTISQEDLLGYLEGINYQPAQ